MIGFDEGEEKQWGSDVGSVGNNHDEDKPWKIGLAGKLFSPQMCHRLGLSCREWIFELLLSN